MCLLGLQAPALASTQPLLCSGLLLGPSRLHPVAVSRVSLGLWPGLSLPWPSRVQLADTGLSLTFRPASDLPVALSKHLGLSYPICRGAAATHMR